MALSHDGQGATPSFRQVLPALIELDLLGEDADCILRDVNVDGYRLQTWDTQERIAHDKPQHRIHYRFTHPAIHTSGWPGTV
jgi:hypothetical protein